MDPIQFLEALNNSHQIKFRRKCISKRLSKIKRLLYCENACDKASVRRNNFSLSPHHLVPNGGGAAASNAIYPIHKALKELVSRACITRKVE